MAKYEGRTGVTQPHHLRVVGRQPNGQPRTYRHDPPAATRGQSAAAYRRLAVAILGLDVPSLAAHLSAARASRSASRAA
jgi:hypothetical protein